MSFLLLLLLAIVFVRTSLFVKHLAHRRRRKHVRTIVVLGSGWDRFLCVHWDSLCVRPKSADATKTFNRAGGHTAEMLALLDKMDLKTYAPRCYVLADTDRLSAQKAKSLELRHARSLGATLPAISQAAPAGHQLASRRGRKDGWHLHKEWEAACEPSGETHQVCIIPRSREVGQSFLSSIPSTLKALWFALRAFIGFRADLLLVNGPGTCLPVAVAARLSNIVGISACKIVYLESIARVARMSLTGKLLAWLRLAHAVLVQWEEMLGSTARLEYHGRLY
jgi:beta-1,4-N-acetylglucosaminyltransferase